MLDNRTYQPQTLDVAINPYSKSTKLKDGAHPVLLMEYGYPATGQTSADPRSIMESSTTRGDAARWFSNGLSQLHGSQYSGTCIGTFMFEYCDEWWNNDTPNNKPPNLCTHWGSATYDLKKYPNGYNDIQGYGLFSVTPGARETQAQGTCLPAACLVDYDGVCSGGLSYGAPVTPVDTLTERTEITAVIKSAYATSPGTWSSRTSPTTNHLHSVAFCPLPTGTTPGPLYPAAWLAVGDNGTALLSQDGKTWQTDTTSVTASLRGITPTGNSILRSVAVGDAGTILFRDQNQWYVQNSGTASNLRGVAFAYTAITNVSMFPQGQPVLVAVGDSGTIVTSPNASTWITRTSGTTNGLTGVTYGLNSQFVAVGATGTILTSPNGTTWTTRTSGTTQGLTGVTYGGNSQFVAVGAAGTVLTSPDGVTWTTQTSGTTQTLTGVTFCYSQFVAVGATGTILTSPDGVTWTSQSSSTTQDLVGVAPGGIQSPADGVTWAAGATSVGAAGTIVTSP